MKTKRSIVIRYSEAFKHQVVKEVAEGHLSCFQAQKKYGIKSSGTISYWMKRMGKLDSLPKVIRVEKPDEKARVKDLERQIRELKNALAETQVRCVIAESRFEVVCEDQGLDPEEVKKKLEQERSKKP
jgi:transposase-like protein